MHNRPADLGVVISSHNAPGDAICVDFFQRPDGSFGYEEYRRDIEDGQGWFPIGNYCGKVFHSIDAARTDAVERVGWLELEM